MWQNSINMEHCRAAVIAWVQTLPLLCAWNKPLQMSHVTMIFSENRKRRKKWVFPPIVNHLRVAVSVSICQALFFAGVMQLCWPLLGSITPEQKGRLWQFIHLARHMKYFPQWTSVPCWAINFVHSVHWQLQQLHLLLLPPGRPHSGFWQIELSRMNQMSHRGLTYIFFCSNLFFCSPTTWQ